MAVRHQNLKPNRYKNNKSGKGSYVLAAFVVVVILTVVAGYVWQQMHQAPVEQTGQAILTKPSIIPPQPVISSLHPAPPAIIQPVPPVRQDYYEGDLPSSSDQPAIQPTTPAQTGKAELAIVVDDMGASLQEARALVAIGVPITLAIIPGLRSYQEVATYAAEHGYEIMVHMPMQPKEYPRRRLESNGLLLEQSDDEIRSRVLGYLAALPNAVGANNHMGSGFTEHQGKMRVVLETLKEEKLFFLDSITTPRTTGFKVAVELRMDRAKRDVFLDNEQNEAYIRKQLAQAVNRARKNGHAIAICHPHPATITVLSKALPELRFQGITLVSVSSLVIR